MCVYIYLNIHIYIYITQHNLYFIFSSGTKMALKFLRKKSTKLRSFLREYSVSLYLSPCPFIINMYGIAFETDEYYVFAQEYALAGDLFDIIPPQVRGPCLFLRF